MILTDLVVFFEEETKLVLFYVDWVGLVVSTGKHINNHTKKTF